MVCGRRGAGVLPPTPSASAAPPGPRRRWPNCAMRRSISAPPLPVAAVVDVVDMVDVVDVVELVDVVDVVDVVVTPLSGGLKRSAPFGTRRTLCTVATSMVTFAVIFGR